MCFSFCFFNTVFHSLNTAHHHGGCGRRSESSSHTIIDRSRCFSIISASICTYLSCPPLVAIILRPCSFSFNFTSRVTCQIKLRQIQTRIQIEPAKLDTLEDSPETNRPQIQRKRKPPPQQQWHLEDPVDYPVAQ
jgi:hypothetical protein